MVVEQNQGSDGTFTTLTLTHTLKKNLHVNRDDDKDKRHPNHTPPSSKHQSINSSRLVPAETPKTTTVYEKRNNEVLKSQNFCSVFLSILIT